MGALFLKKGGGAQGKEAMRHLIRVGVGCFSVGVEAREGQGGSNGLRHLHHFAQQGVSHLSWAQRS